MQDDDFSTADFYGSDGGEDETYDDFSLEPSDDTQDAAPEAPIGEGQGEVEDQPETTYLDLGQYAGQKVRVKVDGEDVEVPVEDLLGGYSRTADYTRKTQELAAQRQEIDFWKSVDAAMRVNPQQTLEYLSKQFGAQQAPAATEAADDDWGQYSDPTEQKLEALQQQLAPAVQYFQQQQAEQYLNQVIDGLNTKYADSEVPFSAQEVVTEALNRGIHDPRMLEAVYRDMSFDRLRAQLSAKKEVATQQQTTDAQKKAAAQQQAALIGSGAGAPRGRAPQSTAPRKYESFADAWAESKAELGYA